MILRCLAIDTPDRQFLALDPRHQAGFVDGAYLYRHARQPEYRLTEQFVARELAMGHECFAIRDGDTLAAYGWYSTTATYFSDDLSVRFGPQWVYMHHGFTHPAYRGRRLHAIAMTLSLIVYRARGFNGLVSLVEARNLPSLNSCLRMGYSRFGTIYTARLGRLLGRRRPSGLLNRVFIFATPGCRAFGFRLDRSPVRVSPVATARAPATSA
jgi:acetyltransferase (GNAT) family protein